MEFIAAILLGFSLVVLVSIIFTAFRQPVTGTGRESEPPIRTKPSADEPTARRAPPA